MRQTLRQRPVVIGVAATAVLAVTALVVAKDDSAPAERGMRPAGYELFPVDPDAFPVQEQEPGSPGHAPPEDADAKPLPPQTPPAETEAEALERAVSLASSATLRQVVGDRGCYRVPVGALAADINAAFESGETDWKVIHFEQVPPGIRIWLCVVEIDGYDGLSTMVIHADPAAPRDLELAMVGTVPAFLDLDTE